MARRVGSWHYFARYWKRVAIGVLALLATATLALLGPWLLGRTVTALQGPDPAGDIPPLAIAMVAAAVGQALIRIVSRVMLFNAAREAEYDLRNDLLANLLRQAPSYYRANPVGDLMSRLTSDVQTVRAMWGPGILNLVNTGFVFTTALVLMLRIDWQLALIAMLPYPAMFGFGKLFGRRLYRSSRSVQDYLGTMSNALQEDLTGIGVIKTYNLEPQRTARFAAMSGELLVRNMALTQVRGQLLPILGGLGSLGAVVVLWLGGRAVIQGRMDLGQLVQFNAYLALLVWPALALGWMLSLFQRGLASWGRLTALLEAEPAIASGGGAAPAELRGRLEIRDLTLELGGRVILDRVSLVCEPGTVTAIVGRTGSGKSTLIEALPRLLELPPGTVFLDGHDVTELPLDALRGAIGYAPQEAFLFSTTIAKNIGYAGDKTREEVLRAAEAAGLTRDLAALPDGLETVVGERGITLSGGQRQRVALARALAAEPRVLVLDDSLSSVDTETEREILGHLGERMKGRTALLISHRLAAIRRADQIAVLDAGRIVERGTHDELLRRGGVYAELYRGQLAEAALAGEAIERELAVMAGGG